MCATTDNLQAKTHRSSRLQGVGVWITAMIVMSLLTVAPVLADVVELKTGQRVEGTFKQATQAGIVIEVGGQTITFDREKVRAIYFGTAPSSVPPQPSASEEAFGALRGLESVTKTGVNYREYARRVLDAKVIVDRYLRSETGQTEVRSKIQAAMQLYEFAAFVWNTDVTRGEYEAIPTHPAVALCPQALQGAVVSAKRFTRRENPGEIAIGIGFTGAGMSPIWSCASDKTAEAERALQTVR